MVPDCTERLGTVSDLSPLFLNCRGSVANAVLERASELITPSVSLPSSQRDTTRTWRGAVKKRADETRTAGYFYLAETGKKDAARVTL